MADAERTVSAVKELRDYAGNVYYVCELEPTGYVISDASYGTIIEYSPSAPSPYLGVEGSLIYLGPTYCYARLNNGMLQNLFSGDVFSSSDDEFTSSAYEISEQIHATQAEYASTATETSTFETSSPAVLLGSSWSPDANSSTITYHYISGGSKLKKLTQRAQIGYYDLPGDDENTRKGVCGYVAAGLLLFWVDECLQIENAINDFAFLRKNGNGFWGTGLTRELLSYGSNNSTAAIDIPFLFEDISDVLDDYAEAHSLEIKYDRDIAVLHTLTSVMEWLDEEKKPVILFGGLHNPQSSGNQTIHAVLAYGWTENSKGDYLEIIAHYGWPNYSEVVVQKATSTFGSSVKLKNVESKPVLITDVTKTNRYSWAYDAAQYCGRYQIIPVINKKFSPSKKVSRGEFVDALYTLSGRPLVALNDDETSDTLKPYTDITKNSPYYLAAAWAVENHVMSGTSSTTLGLSNTLTRAQAAVFLMSYSTKAFRLSYNSTSGPAASNFSDYASIPAWAREGMSFCTKRYLLSGVGENTLSPGTALTRAQIAVILYAISKKATR